MFASFHRPPGAAGPCRPSHGLPFRQLLAYLAGRETCPGLPATLVAATTHRCNLACRMCLRAVRSFQQPDLTPALLWRAIEAGCGLVRHVILDGPGEPLLYEGLFEVIRGPFLSNQPGSCIFDPERKRPTTPRTVPA